MINKVNMCDTPYRTLRSQTTQKSKNSGDSNNSDESTASSTGEISLIAEFDDLQRYYRCIRDDKLLLEASFLNLAEEAKALLKLQEATAQETMRLRGLLDAKTQECVDLDHKLSKARKLIDKEKTNMKNNYMSLLKERDYLAAQLNQVKEVIKDKNNYNLPQETRHKLSFLDDRVTHNFASSCDDAPQYKNLSAIKEINSTGSILSDFSYSRSEDDLDDWILHTGKTGRKHRPSTNGLAEEPSPPKKRRSSARKSVEVNVVDTIRATTTVTVNKEGPILATSVIESVPKDQQHSVKNDQSKPPTNVHSPVPSAPPANLIFESWAKGGSPFKSEGTRSDRILNLRPHNFQSRMVVIPDTCSVCEKRIGFRNTAMKCLDCKAICHVDCKDKLLLHCIPSNGTPNHRKNLGLISDYTPTTPPMVPGILIHCINEIESRGLEEIGIYRIPGAERDVKALKEKFLKGRGVPALSQVEIHVICGCVKDFLRSLKEPLLTYRLRKDFVQAVEAKSEDVRPLLYQIISELPQPNRDTLAYLIQHLQRVAVSPECKMNINNLALMFGPTVVGYSSEDPDRAVVVNEVAQQKMVMENLLQIPTDYWATFTNVAPRVPSNPLQPTPSTDSLIRPETTRRFFSPNKKLVERKQRHFLSPNKF